MKEIWKPIINYDDYYISNFGRIIKKNSLKNKIKEIIPYLKDNGYLQVTLYSKTTKLCYKKYIHRLVAEAFIPNLESKPCVNHKSGIKTDNRVENLEWCTYTENMIHAINNNLWKLKYGKDNKVSLTYVELDIDYNFIREFVGSREENKRLGYTKDTIQRCARGVTKSTHNKIYLLKEEYFENNKNKTKEIHLKKYEINKKKKRKYRNKKTSQTSNVLADILF